MRVGKSIFKISEEEMEYKGWQNKNSNPTTTKISHSVYKFFMPLIQVQYVPDYFV